VFRLVPQHPRPHTAVRRSAAALAGLALAGSTLVATAPAESLTPYHGGWGIARQTSTTTAVACTDGFHGRDTDGRSVLLTAGHCGAAGSVWNSGHSSPKPGPGRRPSAHEPGSPSTG
jgi:hypothetical protein